MTRSAAFGASVLLATGLLLTPPIAAASADFRPAAGEVHEDIATAGDPDQRYALYLPSGYDPAGRRSPVLIVLDPRGRAVPGVERFLPAAERHGYVVLSSHQSRSDAPSVINDRALNALLAEIQARFRFDPRRLYLAGMSGTAHAAWRFGQNLEGHVAGVIAAGGGVQTRTQGPPGKAGFAYYGIAGTKDFNYQELMDLERHLLAEDIDHRIEIFDGWHGWPPHELTNRALEWMSFQAVKRGLAPADEALIDAQLARARAAAGTAEDPLEKLRRHRDIVRDFGALRDVEVDVAALRRLDTDREVAHRQAQVKKLGRAEDTYYSTRLGPWLAEMSDPDRRPPTVKASLVALRVAALEKRAADTKDVYAANSALRTLDSLYTSVAFYLPDVFDQMRDAERKLIALELATEIFPRRARAFWQLAETRVEAGLFDAAFDALRSATALGRVDLERLRTDTTWDPLRRMPQWQELVASIERPMDAVENDEANR